MEYYAVKKGRIPGIYSTLTQCNAQIENYPGYCFNKFKTEVEAIQYLINDNSVIDAKNQSCHSHDDIELLLDDKFRDNNNVQVSTSGRCFESNNAKNDLSNDTEKKKGPFEELRVSEDDSDSSYIYLSDDSSLLDDNSTSNNDNVQASTSGINMRSNIAEDDLTNRSKRKRPNEDEDDLSYIYLSSSNDASSLEDHSAPLVKTNNDLRNNKQITSNSDNVQASTSGISMKFNNAENDLTNRRKRKRQKEDDDDSSSSDDLRILEVKGPKFQNPIKKFKRFKKNENKRKCKRRAVEKMEKNRYMFKTNIGEEDGTIYIYTDGAYKNNKAGIGVYFGENHLLNLSERIQGIQSSSRAEIIAVVRALEQVKRFPELMSKKLILFTDNLGVIQSVQKNIQRWKNCGWRKRKKKKKRLKVNNNRDNREIVHRDEYEMLEVVMQGLNIQWEHVRGHCGILGNELADKLAAASLALPNI